MPPSAQAEARKDRLSPAARSLLMARIRSKDHWPGQLMEQLLLEKRLPRFERHPSGIPGRPDFVFKAQKLVLFVDGDFWHGRGFHHWKAFLTEDWRRKIARNVMRDKQQALELRALGWRVCRVWENDLKKDPRRCLRRVMRFLGIDPRGRKIG